MVPAENKSFSLRDWLGLTVGVSWGLVLGRFFSSGDMAGVWLVVLLGPPAMLLISPSRPLVGWQVPILAAAVSSALISRDSQDTVGMFLSDAALVWFVCSLFSWPWALIFHHRAKHGKQPSAMKRNTVSYVGLVLLVFLSCALTVVGFALTLYPASSPNSGNRAVPFYGFLIATAGVGLSATSLQIARNLGVNKPITDMMQLLLLLPSILGISLLLTLFYRLVNLTNPSRSSSSFEIWCTLAGLEALVVLIWVTLRYRREQIRSS